MDINSLRKMKNTNYAAVTEAINKIQNPQGQEDTRFWKPERDKAGNGKAVIRFLPAKTEEDLPWVRVFSHSFKGPTGKYYIENCLSTIGKDDPVNELNSTLWESGIEANKKIAQKQKRRLHFISNIEVINDPKNPDNNGKVFLFKYGKKIFDKIISKQNPTFDDDKKIIVWDLWEGANFTLRVKTVDDYPNYDDSVFEAESVLHGGDEEKLLATMNATYDLKEFIDPSKFKAYDVLKKRLEYVLGEGTAPAGSSKVEDNDAPVKEAKSAPVREEKKAASKPAPTDDDDDDVSYFNNIDFDDDIPF